MSNTVQDVITRTAEALEKNRKAQNDAKAAGRAELPDRQAVYDILEDLYKISFAEYLSDETPGEEALFSLYEKLSAQIEITGEGRARAEELAATLVRKIPDVQELLQKDVEAHLAGDPAANSREEIILAYPGLYAIFVYRYAHILYQLKTPLLPRVMSEYAHGRTGIDINPGAVIGEYFFIDHGTGVVIGETAIIGNGVRIYQGVTIGALSTRKGQALSGVKRHPTIEDNVIIYANATILGGDTVVGKNATVAGNTFVTKSIPADAKVSAMMPELRVKVYAEEGKQ